MAEKVVTTRPAVQFYEAILEDVAIQPDFGYQRDATATSQVRTPETGNTKLEAVDTLYHTARHDREGRREQLDRLTERENEKSYNTIAKSRTTTI